MTPLKDVVFGQFSLAIGALFYTFWWLSAFKPSGNTGWTSGLSGILDGLSVTYDRNDRTTSQSLRDSSPGGDFHLVHFRLVRSYDPFPSASLRDLP